MIKCCTSFFVNLSLMKEKEKAIGFTTHVLMHICTAQVTCQIYVNTSIIRIFLKKEIWKIK